MATVPAETNGPSDAELIDEVRKGRISAYGVLYERHCSAAYQLARQLSRSETQADDLVSEAFAKVLETLKAGRGPDSAFRTYLLTALRHTFYDKTRRDRRLELAQDVTEVGGVSVEAVSVPFTDPAVAGLERTLAARAFARLTERWQTVLWHTAIEGQSPAEVAPILGLTPNAVSALAYRAREALKEAYLQVHLAETKFTEARCATTNDKLGAWTRGGLSKREKAQVEAHLDKCDRCRALAAELADVNSSLRIFVAPLVLGTAAVGYLASVGATTNALVATGGAATAGVVGTGVAAAAGGSSAVGAAGGGASRQVVGVTTSAAAVAAAVALALSAGGGDQRITLEPGGGPAYLPITVPNPGQSASGPVSATLTLPPGVTAIPAGPTLPRPNPPAITSGPDAATVFCPGGTGTVTCGTDAEVPPGGSVILLFRLVAAPNSPGGEVTGTASDGTTINIPITVPVVVSPRTSPPPHS